MKTKTFYSLCLYLFSPIAVWAQTPDSLPKPKPQLKLSVNYNSNLNYYGRTDSLQSTGFFPMAEFWITPGFYLNAAPVFISNKAAAFEYAGTVATMGFQKSSKKWFRTMYLTKPIYKQSSGLVQSALKVQSGASVTRLNKVVNLTLGGDVKWSDKLDVGTTTGLDHIVRMERGKTVYILDPTVMVYAGTQQYSQTFTKKKSGTLLRPATTQQVTRQQYAFNILAYEISMPLIYARGPWLAMATPSYIIPQHLIAVASRPDLSESGKKTAYATVTLKHTF